MHARSLTAILLFGVSAIALVSPAAAQTAPETTAQAVNGPAGRERLWRDRRHRDQARLDHPGRALLDQRPDRRKTSSAPMPRPSRTSAATSPASPCRTSGRGRARSRSAACRPGRSSATSRASRNRSASTSTNRSSRCRCSPPISTCSTSTASKRCAARRARCSGRAASAARIRYITNQPKLGLTEGLIEANINTVEEDDIGGHVKGAINVPLGDTAAVRVVGYGQEFAGFIDAIGPGGRQERQRRQPRRRPRLLAVGADRRAQHHAARGLSGDPRQRLQPRGGVQPLRQPADHDASARHLRRARAISAAARAASRTRPCSPT